MNKLFNGLNDLNDEKTADGVVRADRASRRAGTDSAIRPVMWMTLKTLKTHAKTVALVSMVASIPTIAVVGYALRSPVVHGHVVRAAHTPTPSKTATVAVYDEGLPFARRKVIFHDASGRIRAVKETGSDGRATSEVVDGDMITVAIGGSKYELWTITDVHEGDVIVVGESARHVEPRVRGIVRPALPGPRPEANDYALTVGVGVAKSAPSDAPPAFQVLDSYVDREGRLGVFAEARDDRGVPTAYAVARPVAPNGGETTRVTFPAWRTDWQRATVELTHVPSGARAAEVKLTIPSSPGRFVERHDEVTLHGADARVDFKVPRDLGEADVVDVDVEYDEASSSTLQRRTKGTASQLNVDLAGLLPRVSKAGLDSASAADEPDSARPRLRWSVDGDGRAADFSMAVLEWPETAAHKWTVLAPPGTTSWRAPELPDELRAFRPDAGPMSISTALVDASFVNGYDDVRHRGVDMLEDLPDEPYVLRVSASGKIDF